MSDSQPLSGQKFVIFSFYFLNNMFVKCSCSKKRQLQLNTYNGFKALQFKETGTKQIIN